MVAGGGCVLHSTLCLDGTIAGLCESEKGSIEMKLSLEEVDHVALLARLGLAPDERERMRDQLSSILEHISLLEEIDTEAIPPTAQVITLENVMRDDEVRPSLPVEDVLRNAPRSEDNMFKVNAVLEES
jgi:aspartyl-tRNA(Asn)/glutamyl-tRNA(Gln) amidotransferase subunit C